MKGKKKKSEKAERIGKLRKKIKALKKGANKFQKGGWRRSEIFKDYVKDLIEKEKITGKTKSLLLELSEPMHGRHFRETLKALGKTKDPRVVPALIQQLKQGDRHPRREVIDALAEINNQQARDALIKLLKIPFYSFKIDRHHLIGTLGKIKATEACPHLVEFLRQGSIPRNPTGKMAYETLKKLSFEMVKGDKEAEAQMRFAEKNFGEGFMNTDKENRALFLYAIASQPNIRRNIPTEASDRVRMEYFLSLRRELKGKYGFDIMNVLFPKKKGKK